MRRTGTGAPVNLSDSVEGPDWVPATAYAARWPAAEELPPPALYIGRHGPKTMDKGHTSLSTEPVEDNLYKTRGARRPREAVRDHSSSNDLLRLGGSAGGLRVPPHERRIVPRPEGKSGPQRATALVCRVSSSRSFGPEYTSSAVPPRPFVVTLAAVHLCDKW